MNIKWYSKNHDVNPQGMSPNYQMIEKFLGNYPDSRKDLIYLVIGHKLDRNRIFSKFIENVNIYKNFNIRIGFASDMSSLKYKHPEKPTFFIGNNSDYNELLSTKANKTIVSSVGNKDIDTIGYQRHLSEKYNLQSISLGELNQSFDNAEALLRKAEIILFDLNSIKRQESFSTRSKLTGLTLQESCSLARFAGMSDNHKLFFINTGNDIIKEETEEVIALLFWYYLEGQTFNSIESMDKDSITYLVESEHFEEAITFSKGKITGRWSFIHPLNQKIYPCTEADYHKFSKGELLESMINLIEH